MSSQMMSYRGTLPFPCTPSKDCHCAQEKDPTPYYDDGACSISPALPRGELHAITAANHTLPTAAAHSLPVHSLYPLLFPPPPSLMSLLLLLPPGSPPSPHSSGGTPALC